MTARAASSGERGRRRRSSVRAALTSSARGRRVRRRWRGDVCGRPWSASDARAAIGLGGEEGGEDDARSAAVSMRGGRGRRSRGCRRSGRRRRCRGRGCRRRSPTLRRGGCRRRRRGCGRRRRRPSAAVSVRGWLLRSRFPARSNARYTSTSQAAASPWPSRARSARASASAAGGWVALLRGRGRCRCGGGRVVAGRGRVADVDVDAEQARARRRIVRGWSTRWRPSSAATSSNWSSTGASSGWNPVSRRRAGPDSSPRSYSSMASVERLGRSRMPEVSAMTK